MGNEDLGTKTIENKGEGIETIVTQVHLDNMDINVVVKALLNGGVCRAYLKREKASLPIPSSQGDKIIEIIKLKVGDRLDEVFDRKPYEIILEYAGKADY